MLLILMSRLKYSISWQRMAVTFTAAEAECRAIRFKPATLSVITPPNLCAFALKRTGNYYLTYHFQYYQWLCIIAALRDEIIMDKSPDAVLVFEVIWSELSNAAFRAVVMAESTLKSFVKYYSFRNYRLSILLISTVCVLEIIRLAVMSISN